MRRVRAQDLDVGGLRGWVAAANGTFSVMRSFLGLMPSPALIKDAHGRVLYINVPAMAMFRVTEDKIFGDTLSRFSPYHDGEAALRRQEIVVTRQGNATVSYGRIFVGAEKQEKRIACAQFPFQNDSTEIFIAWMAIEFTEPAEPTEPVVPHREPRSWLAKYAPWILGTLAVVGFALLLWDAFVHPLAALQ